MTRPLLILTRLRAIGRWPPTPVSASLGQQQCRQASHAKGPVIIPGQNLSSTSPGSPNQSTKQNAKKTSKSRSGQSVSSSASSSSSSSSATLPKPRLDFKKMTSDPKSVTLNHVLRKSGLHTDTVFHITRLHDTALSLGRKLDSVRSKQRDVGNLVKAGGGEEALQQAKKLKEKVVEYEKVLEETEMELLELGLKLPNETCPLTPVGKEENAIELERIQPSQVTSGGTDVTVPKDPKRDHLDLSIQFGWLDPPASAVASGNSWPYLKGTLSLLEQAIVQYSLSIAVRHGWTPVTTPDVVKEDVMARCGFQPRDPSQAGQIYHLSTSALGTHSDQEVEEAQQTRNNLVLAATAEIPLAALSANKIIPYSSLPIRYVGVGKAFRAEAGARGADTRGLYRLHQFTKVELFAVTEGDKAVSESMMQEITGIQREVVKGLGLTVRVLDMPTEELGASAYRKFDMEAWMPGRGKWGEISSTSNCTDYQARRLHIRHRHGNPMSSDGNSLPFAHTLNGTCAAIPRLLIALIENGVQFDDNEQVNGMDLPQALRPFWIGGDAFAPPSKEGRKYLINWV